MDGVRDQCSVLTMKEGKMDALLFGGVNLLWLSAVGSQEIKKNSRES